MKKAKESNLDSSCSLSDNDSDEETELSNNGEDLETQALNNAHKSEVAMVQHGPQGMTWSEVKDLFAVLDACNFESVGFREFCAHVLLLAAMEDNQLLQCLYQHGVLLFDIIGGG